MSSTNTELPFDPTNVESIYEYAKRLEGHTLREMVRLPLPQAPEGGNKGTFGQYIERYYFGYENNNEAEPDFKKAGLELKTSSLEMQASGRLAAKERIKLGAINYKTLPQERWESCSLMRKNRRLLVIFTVHDPALSVFDRRIELVRLWDYPSADLAVIREDWQTVKGLVEDERAHELSEGATNYLGACTSGPGHHEEGPKGKPKPRSFALKQSYVRSIVQSDPRLKATVKDLEELNETGSLRRLIEQRFRPYFGWTASEMAGDLAVRTRLGAKSYYADITKAVLGASHNEEVAELTKADVQVKTLRLRKNNTPKEDLAFPAFKFVGLVDEGWEESEFLATLQRPFMFVLFKVDDRGTYRLRDVRFWSMPATDIEMGARPVWEATVERIRSGRYDRLPKKKFVSDCDVAHVRPHATKGQTFPTLQGGVFTRQSFWLNRRYLREQVTLDVA
jgi:DNA mismatch repair protein MutH